MVKNFEYYLNEIASKNVKNKFVIILGADISDMEWDIWNAIVNRERNYGKKKNIAKPIYQMRTLSSENKNKTKTKSNEIWFKPLFDENLSFEKQWNKLETLFK